ncbi:MAG: transglycosylase SLT domain-containing protein [Rhodanobacteraceae bacterium]
MSLSFVFTPSLRARHMCWPLILICTLLALPCVASAAGTLQQQRDAFRAAYAAAYAGQDWRTLAQGLEDYPLYPYLEAAALEHNLRDADRAQIAAYLARYPDLIPADDLRRDELLLLAQQQDWQGFLYFYKPGLSDALTCDALQARAAQGQRLDFQRDLAALWSKPRLPSACAGVLDAADAQGLLTTQRIWERIDRAADAGAAATISRSASWLPPADAAAAQRLAQAIDSPASLLASAITLPDDARTRQALTLALTHYARRHAAPAQSAWQQVSDRFAFDGNQRDKILAALALYNATDYTDSSLATLAALPPSAQTDATREWRVRVALALRDWNAALAATNALTADEMQHDEWRYWHARASQKLGHAGQARNEYASLAKVASFYGFLATDRAGLPYTICPEQLAGGSADEQRLLAIPGMTRAFELFALEMLQPARREWDRALARLSGDDRRLAADLAYRRGWYDRAVFAFANDADLHLYEQRFPLADEPRVVAAAQSAGIDPAWAYAIIRAESAWQTDAHSVANAYGLMQLLPGTASRVAQGNGLPYDGADDLYDPRINIPLGAHYLADMAMRYDGSPWLATASYNAGPGAVQRWVDARGELEPDAFIATIPYKETREYVARVLSFEVLYDWRLHGNVLPESARLPAIGTAYAPPTTDAARKSAVCTLGYAPAATKGPDTQPAPAASSASSGNTNHNGYRP